MKFKFPSFPSWASFAPFSKLQRREIPMVERKEVVLSAKEYIEMLGNRASEIQEVKPIFRPIGQGGLLYRVTLKPGRYAPLESAAPTPTQQAQPLNLVG